MRHLLAAALALSMLPAAASAGDAPIAERLPVLAGTQHIEHVSPLLGRPLQIFIKRPAGASEDGDEPLPIIYALDADQAFPLLASYSWALTFNEEMSPAILVGIGYGSIAQGVNMRGTDYTVPSATREGTGGAATFLEVIEQEIIPLVEAQVSADPERRMLVGQSLGGHFVLYQALERPGLFDLGLAINPAIHNSPEWFMEALATRGDVDGEQALFVTSAEDDVPRFGNPARQFLLAAQANPPQGLCIAARVLDDHQHLTSMPAAFRAAMRWQADPERTCGEFDPRLAEVLE